jgi:hypothetical protein
VAKRFLTRQYNWNFDVEQGVRGCQVEPSRSTVQRRRCTMHEVNSQALNIVTPVVG